MFTLKLYRIVNGQKSTLIRAVHHVQVMEIGEAGKTLELWAFEPDGSFEAFFIGERQADMTAVDGFWGWGLLENAAGKTSEHYRPFSYGLGDCGDLGPTQAVALDAA